MQLKHQRTGIIQFQEITDISGETIQLGVLFDQTMAPLIFRKPTLKEVCVSASRLLRFTPPEKHPVHIIQKFLKACFVASSDNKKSFLMLGLIQQEQIYKKLWQVALGTEANETQQTHWINQQITRQLTAIDLYEFDCNALIQSDLAVLEASHGQLLHGYYFDGAFTPEKAEILLQALNLTQSTEINGQQPQPFSQKYASTQAANEYCEQWQTHYYFSRQFSKILPWVELTTQAEKNNLMPQFPTVQQIGAITKQANIKQAPTKPEQTPEIQASLLLTLPSRPVQQLIFVEGETEKLLLPVHLNIFCQLLYPGQSHSLSFMRVMAVGGKSNMLSFYQQYTAFRGAVFVLLDADAQDVKMDLSPIKRPQDKIYRIEGGEFEDLYHPRIVVETLRSLCHLNTVPFSNIPEREGIGPTETGFDPLTLEKEMLGSTEGMASFLKKTWLQLNLGGQFDKVLFARLYGQTLQQAAIASKNDLDAASLISNSLQDLLKQLINL
ncbi:MAG: TOPRIM nucleotidyl transferase/hydrolase domain-containing protein [Cyanobacteria bacterium P01_H01_bin.74]